MAKLINFNNASIIKFYVKQKLYRSPIKHESKVIFLLFDLSQTICNKDKKNQR